IVNALLEETTMARVRRASIFLGVAIVVALVGSIPHAQTPQTTQAPRATAAASALTTPMQEWGHDIGDDYFLVNYKQLGDYWKKLEKQSNRPHVVGIGKSSEGRPIYMAVITPPANYAKIETYKSISKQLA